MIAQLVKEFCLLWNRMVLYRVHNSPLLVPVLTDKYNTHIHNLFLQKAILILSSYLLAGPPSGLFPSGFPANFLKFCCKFLFLRNVNVTYKQSTASCCLVQCKNSTSPRSTLFLLLSHISSTYEKVLQLCKNLSQNFAGFTYTFSSPLNMKKCFLQFHLSVCLSVRGPTIWLSSARAVRPILFIFGIQQFMHHISVPGESEHSNPTNRSLLIWPRKNKTEIFKKTFLTILIKFHYWDYLSN